MELLGSVLKRWEKLGAVASLGSVSVNALFDSELEARFIGNASTKVSSWRVSAKP